MFSKNIFVISFWQTKPKLGQYHYKQVLMHNMVKIFCFLDVMFWLCKMPNKCRNQGLWN